MTAKRLRSRQMRSCDWGNDKLRRAATQPSKKPETIEIDSFRLLTFGTGGGTRTHMGRSPLDFESSAYADSATPADGREVYCLPAAKASPRGQVSVARPEMEDGLSRPFPDDGLEAHPTEGGRDPRGQPSLPGQLHSRARARARPRNSWLAADRVSRTRTSTSFWGGVIPFGAAPFARGPDRSWLERRRDSQFGRGVLEHLLVVRREGDSRLAPFVLLLPFQVAGKVGTVETGKRLHLLGLADEFI